MGDRKLYRLRVAAQADVPALVRVINLAYRVEQFFIRGDRTSVEEVSRLIAAPAGAFLVLEAEDGSGLAGSVYLTVTGETGHLGFLAVDPARQGQGLGHRLLAEVEARCREAGCVHLDLAVFNVREDLLPFYRSAGFAQVDTSDYSRPDLLRSPAHLIRMRKPLTRSHAP